VGGALVSSQVGGARQEAEFLSANQYSYYPTAPWRSCPHCGTRLTRECGGDYLVDDHDGITDRNTPVVQVVGWRN
jgi:hypothetical protein